MNHIKVYKTDVEDRSAAQSIRNELKRLFHEYDVSFDLEDCDKVLRVESINGPVDESALTRIYHQEIWLWARRSKALGTTLNNYLNN